MNKKLSSLLSLCQRAGFLVSGEGPSEIAIKKKNGKLVLISSEASNNTKKKFINAADYYDTPIHTIECSKEEFGQIIGKGERSVIVICDANFKNQIEKLILCDM